MKKNKMLLGCVAFAVCASALASPAALPAADQAAAFKAAGFRKAGAQWRKCEDPTASSGQGMIAEVRDVNGDGRPEAVITEGGTFCYGHTGAGFSVVSKQRDGSWKLMTSGTGIATFLPTKGAGGWPDIEVGGPGFCFPVERWNGRAYKQHRYQYEGKSCKPPQ